MKNWIKGTNAAVLSLAVVGIFIVLTIFLHSLKGGQIDLTKGKKFTLSDNTITTMKELKQPIHAIVFTDPGSGPADPQVTDLLAEYHKLNGKFTYEQVDPKKQPTLAEQYKIDQYGTVVFASGDKTKNVNSSDLYGQGAEQGSYTFNGEEKFTQAIISLASTEQHHIYLLTGHGELTSANAGQFAGDLRSENYVVQDLNLFKEGKVPDDAETVLALSPQNDISDQEAALLKDYAKNKGKLLIALDAIKDMDKWKNWNDILGVYGVKNEFALALDSKRSLSTDPFVIVPTFGTHDIVDKLSQQGRITMLPGALALSKQDNPDWQISTLLTTSAEAYGKTDLSALLSGKQVSAGDLNKTDKDLKGPLALAYAIADKNNKPKAVVIGNSTFVTNQMIGQQANRDFILNSIGWLQEQKNQVTIRPRQEDQMQQAVITPGKSNLIFIGTVVLFPLLFLLIGGTIWWRRRKG